MRLVILAEEPPAELRAQLVFFEVCTEEQLLSLTSFYPVKAEVRALPFLRLCGVEVSEVGKSVRPGDLVAWPLPERPGRNSRWKLMLV